MRFVPALGLTSVPALMRKAGGVSIPPADQKSVPAGVLPQAQADMTDLDGWTIGPSWTDQGGALQKFAGASQEFIQSDIIEIPAGDIWVSYTARDATAGVTGVQLQGPFRNSVMQNKVTAQHIARFDSVGHTRVRAFGTNTYDGTFDDLQVVDMNEILAQPADIYIAAGQSMIAAENNSFPVDPDKDFWIPRCLFVPGVDNPTYGSVAGVRTGCVAPLQMSGTTQGVSPATTFARMVEGSTAAGRSILILGCAAGGTRLVGNDAEWHPDATVGNGATLYNTMITRIIDALALNPGNVVKGLIWGQGESDRSMSMDVDYPPAFGAMLSALRADTGKPNLPVMLIGPMPDDTTSTQPMFIATQEKLDQDSGDASAIAGVHYIARPTGYMSDDGTHPVAEGNRIAGRLAAQRFIAEGYL